MMRGVGTNVYAEFGLRGFTELLTLPLFKKNNHISHILKVTVLQRKAELTVP